MCQSFVPRGRMRGRTPDLVLRVVHAPLAVPVLHVRPVLGQLRTQQVSFAPQRLLLGHRGQRRVALGLLQLPDRLLPPARRPARHILDPHRVTILVGRGRPAAREGAFATGDVSA